MTKTEILAPAGSYEMMTAAFNAGADAVYLAGKSFGARAYANNLDNEMLIKAIEEAHVRGKKLYLTVNTLLKERELKEMLYDYLAPLYEAGLDAVIVQDFGVLDYIRRHFKSLDIHASTQMTVTDASFAKWLRQLGVTRVVPARELSLEEIRHIKAESGLEVETFVHGALCYCYSGQCLLSSMLGGRSGNRGRCAQPCRLPYELIAGQGEKKERLNRDGENYLLSPKDIAALKIIPDLVDAGIDSFKIEGRMKKPEYAALVSALYKKYTGLYEQKGRQGYKVDDEDIRRLMDLYNRGGFTDGYYKNHNGRAMMSLVRPNHFGTKAAEVTSVTKQKIQLRALEDLNSGDVLELMPFASDKRSLTLRSASGGGKFRAADTPERGKERCGERGRAGNGTGSSKIELTLKESVSAQKTFYLKRIDGELKTGGIFYRTRNQKLIDEISQSYVLAENKEKIYGCLTISKDLPATMKAEYRGISVSVAGVIPQAAQSRPLEADDVRKRMMKTGNTPFEFEKLDIDIEDGLYMDIKALNALRRDTLSALSEAVVSAFRRKLPAAQSAAAPDKAAAAAQEDRLVSVLLGGAFQLDTVLQSKAADRIYMEISDFAAIEDKADVVRKVFEAGKSLYVALPHIFREDIRKLCEKLVKEALQAGISGFLVRGAEAFLFISSVDEHIPIIADTSVYTFNSEAADFWKNAGICQLTAPLELNEKELRQRGCRGDEVIIYGYMPLMLSAQCPLKTTGRCLKENKADSEKLRKNLYLKDRKGTLFKVKPICKYCYSVIYNSRPLMFSDELKKLSDMGFSSARIVLTDEKEQEVKRLLDTLGDGWKAGKNIPNYLENFTKGHFKRGVE